MNDIGYCSKARIARRCIFLALTSNLAWFGLSGCAVDTYETAGNPWAAQFASVYQSATNNLVRDIVRDGELTLVDMRYAAARTNECIALTGSPAKIVEDGLGGFAKRLDHRAGYEGNPDPAIHHGSREIMEATFECELEYFNELWILWDLIRNNPTGEDFDTLVADCLTRNDLAPPGFSGSEFHEIAWSCAFRWDEDPSNPISHEELIELIEKHNRENYKCRPQLPGGAYLNEGLAWDCQMDPLNH